MSDIETTIWASGPRFALFYTPVAPACLIRRYCFIHISFFGVSMHVLMREVSKISMDLRDSFIVTGLFLYFSFFLVLTNGEYSVVYSYDTPLDLARCRL